MSRYQPVDAIRSQPPHVSLLAAAGMPDGELRFSDGLRWLPELSGSAGSGAVAIGRTEGGAAGATHNTVSRAGSLTVPPDERLNEPFVVWVGEKTSTLGSRRDIEQRAQRALLSVESYHVAATLWDGDLWATAAPGGETQSFTGGTASQSVESDVITVGPETTIADALGVMEAGLAAALAGRRGMIHVTPQVLVHAVAEEVVLISGSTERPVFRTAMGHAVVADAGYSGNGPGSGGENDADALSQWIYGTGPLIVHMGPVSLTDPARLEGIDYAANTIVPLADRPFVVQWDQDVLLAVEVGIGSPVAEIGGAS